MGYNIDIEKKMLTWQRMSFWEYFPQYMIDIVLLWNRTENELHGPQKVYKRPGGKTLYRDFIRQTTKEAEYKYKKYKNKFTDILRVSKNDDYKRILDDNRNNIKGIWKILKSIIRTGAEYNNLPNYFIDKDSENYNMKDVANSFNELLVNVGPELESKKNPCFRDIWRSNYWEKSLISVSSNGG